MTFALQRRKAARRGDHAIPAARLEKLFTDDRHPLRERTLWRLLYETAARAEEILCLNVEDRDVEYRRARVVSKSGAVEHVHWATATARLLPRLLKGREAGPVFVTDRRAPTSGPRMPAAADLCPISGRGRLSYPRAEYLFKTASVEFDPPGGGWTLHQLRAQCADPPGRRRPHRARTAGQVPPSGSGQPGPLRPPGRGDLRPHHCRARPRSTTTTQRLTRPAPTGITTTAEHPSTPPAHHALKAGQHA